MRRSPEAVAALQETGPPRPGANARGRPRRYGLSKAGAAQRCGHGEATLPRQRHGCGGVPGDMVKLRGQALTLPPRLAQRRWGLQRRQAMSPSLQATLRSTGSVQVSGCALGQTVLAALDDSAKLPWPCARARNHGATRCSGAVQEADGHAGDCTRDLPHAERARYHYATCPEKETALPQQPSRRNPTPHSRAWSPYIRLRLHRLHILLNMVIIFMRLRLLLLR